MPKNILNVAHFPIPGDDDDEPDSNLPLCSSSSCKEAVPVSAPVPLCETCMRKAFWWVLNSIPEPFRESFDYRHSQFRASRTIGEWFEQSDDLMGHIKKLRAAEGVDEGSTVQAWIDRLRASCPTGSAPHGNAAAVDS